VQIGRVKKSLFILVLPLILILASCSAINSSKAVLSGLQVQLDENFSGPLSEWKKQFVYLKWNIESPPEIEKYRIDVIFRFPGEESKPLEAEFAYDGTNLGSKPDLIAGEGTERVLTLNNLDKLLVFGAMADHSAGSNVDFKITLLQAKSDNDSVPIQDTVSWKRPELKFASPTPKLEYVTQSVESAEPCYKVTDQATFSFDSRPQEYLVTINGKPYIDPYGDQSSVQAKLRNLLYWEDNENLYVGVECARTAGEKYVYEVISKNEVGSSDESTLTFKSIKPGISQSEIDESNKSQRIGNCTGALKITENTASDGDCGFVGVEVIQSDLDTGSCNFLANWTDKNGSKRTGLFEYCGAFRPAAFKKTGSTHYM
jgi:hypothetical protein